MTVRIALAQHAAAPDRDLNLQKALRDMERAHAAGAQLITFPEMGLSRFFPQHQHFPGAKAIAETIPGPTVDILSAKAKELSMVTVPNLYEIDGQGRCFDTSPVIDADGKLLGVTRMVHITDYPCFHERNYYHPGDTGAPVYDTAVGRIGVAICYDRHYPEYMRALGLRGAKLVIIPQAGALGEWPEGMYEAEVRTASFQNGYFTALCNRTGVEDCLEFGGESFVVDPEGKVIARGKSRAEDLVIVDLDFDACEASAARRLFWQDRRPELYGDWLR